jgi:hypothetical protein
MISPFLGRGSRGSGGPVGAGWWTMVAHLGVMSGKLGERALKPLFSPTVLVSQLRGSGGPRATGLTTASCGLTAQREENRESGHVSDFGRVKAPGVDFADGVCEIWVCDDFAQVISTICSDGQERRDCLIWWMLRCSRSRPYRLVRSWARPAMSS